MLALEGDHCGILSLLGTAVEASSPSGVMRKQYLLLSTKVHPDKHPEKTRHLATKAFQVTRLDTSARACTRTCPRACVQACRQPE